MMKKIGFAILAGAFAGSVFAAEFKDLDANQDGVISANEAEAAGMDITKIDANQDGSVDEAEFSKFVEEAPPQ